MKLNDLALRAASALPPQAIDREALLGALLNALAQALADFNAAGLAPFISRWNALHAWRGEAVAVLDQGRVRQQGIALGIDDAAADRPEPTA